MTDVGRTVVERAFDVARATLPRAPRDRLAHPFGFGEHDPYEWRVSRDVWDELCDYAGMNEPDPSPESRLLGERIRIDETLPPDSMLLEGVRVNGDPEVVTQDDPETWAADDLSWVTCPRCDQRLIDSRNGWRRHNEGCPALFDQRLWEAAHRSRVEFSGMLRNHIAGERKAAEVALRDRLTNTENRTDG